MEILPFLQIPVNFGMESLEEIREKLRREIKPDAKPCIVTIKDKAPGNVYVVCPNSYDTEFGTVQIFRASDPADQKETVKWSKCKIV